MMFLLLAVSVFGAERSVSVVGHCLKNIVPDRASIRITADIIDKNVSVASKKAAETYEKVRDDVKKLNLADAELDTAEYSVQESREWNGRSTTFKGYRARIGLDVATSDIKRMGEIIAIASKYGLRETGQLNNFLSDYKNKTERESCLEDAIKNARSKADRMAKAAGAKVGRVLSISESKDSVPTPRPMYAEAKQMAADAVAPHIETKNETMSVEVAVSFELD